MTDCFDNMAVLPSPIGVFVECREDPFPNKINLTVAVYRSEEGEPWVLPCVREAEEFLLSQKLDHEYMEFYGSNGLPGFVVEAQKLAFGVDAKVLKDGRVYTAQALGGTGSIRVALDLMKVLSPDCTVYIPEVTWPNHPQIAKVSGLKQARYRYLDDAGTGFGFNKMLEDLKACPSGSVVILNACSQNPTGADPTDDQWKEILEVFKNRKLVALFDNAYQGAVSGDPEIDAYSMRLFADSGLNFIIACSFSKNFGLYGERIGCVHVITSSPQAAAAVGSQVRYLIRSLWSCCPVNAARVVYTVLSDPKRKADWYAQLVQMADRIHGVRQLLHDQLVERNVKGTWDHVLKQRGMFCFSGLSVDVIRRLKEYHIYMQDDSRIALGGLNHTNMPVFVDALVAIIGTN